MLRIVERILVFGMILFSLSISAMATDGPTNASVDGNAWDTSAGLVSFWIPAEKWTPGVDNYKVGSLTGDEHAVAGKPFEHLHVDDSFPVPASNVTESGLSGNEITQSECDDAYSQIFPDYDLVISATPFYNCHGFSMAATIGDIFWIEPTEDGVNVVFPELFDVGVFPPQIFIETDDSGEFPREHSFKVTGWAGGGCIWALQELQEKHGISPVFETSHVFPEEGIVTASDVWQLHYTLQLPGFDPAGPK